MTIDPAVLGHKEAARYLGIDPDTLWRHRGTDRIPFVRLWAGKIGYLKKDLDAWLASRRVSSRDDVARLMDGRRRVCQ